MAVNSNLVRDKLAELAMATETSLLQHRKIQQWQVGDQVWIDARVFDQTYEERKFRDKFLGPFVVLEVMGKNNYRLDIAQRFPRMKDNVFNAKFLRPHVAREPHLVEPIAPQPLPDYYEVAKLLDDRVRRGVKQYLVRWKGFSSDADTWEPLAHLSRTSALRQLVQQYEDKRAERRQRTRRA